MLRSTLFFAALLLTCSTAINATTEYPLCIPYHGLLVTDACIQFSVAAGTGCAWMCSYCADRLGTSSYYFTDGVCTYQSGGCVGNPIAGTLYTCCRVGSA